MLLVADSCDMDLLKYPTGNNTGYYSTCCIVCHSSEELKRCSKCKMISYCCSKHQKIHWPKHKHICAAINRALTVGGMALPGQDKQNGLAYDDYYPQEVWTDQITALMSVIEMSMERQFDADERSMILFPRSCRVCRDMDHTKLFCCVACRLVSYCSKTHRDKDYDRHAKDCPHLAFSFQLSQFLNETSEFKQPPSLVFAFRNTYCHLPLNIHSYMKLQCLKGAQESLEDRMLGAIRFGENTNPLTFLYAVEKIGFPINRKTLIVHIVGPSQKECAECIFWEDVLHWLPDLKELKLILIGPDAAKFYCSSFSPLCNNCTHSKRSLHFTTCTMLYHEYFQSDSFVTPDIVVAFNCGFSEFEGSSNDTWTASLPLMANPWLVFTSFNILDAVRDVHCMKNICKKLVKVVLEAQENPFRGTIPHREFEFDTVFFTNYYLTIIKME